MNLEELQQNTYDQFADQYAQFYDQSNGGGFNFNRDFIIPRLLNVVGNVAGLTVLDAGCGEGIVSRFLADSSAKVIGIDVSPRLIELARDRDVKKAITYEVRDLSQPLPSYEQTFDVVVSNMVLNDVPDYNGFIATLSAVLKPKGRLVISLNNPYSAVIREKVESYFDTGKAVPYNWDGMTVYYFHHTMEEYLTAFQRVGVLLRSLSDLQMTEEIVARLPEQNRQFPWFQMYYRFPFIVILEFVRPTS
jgi:2-polyprenyl-3-methyl-5-hydroxy-6-metoxy-1,4-benzoquinol methylase